MSDWLEERDACVMVNVSVVARAARARVVGAHAGRLQVQLPTDSVTGPANRLLLKFMADELGDASVQLDIAAGLSSKRKTVRIAGVKAQRIRLLFEPPSLLLD